MNTTERSVHGGDAAILPYIKLLRPLVNVFILVDFMRAQLSSTILIDLFIQYNEIFHVHVVMQYKNDYTVAETVY